MLEEKYRALRYLLLSLALIVVGGVIMVYSSSYIYAKEMYGSSSYLFQRQLLYIILGIGLIFILSKTKFLFRYKYSYHLNIFFTFILLLTFVPGIGVHTKGAYRWLKVGGLVLQPAEFIKYTLLLSSIYFFYNYQRMEIKERVGHAVTLLFPLGVLLKQPDFGTFTICMAMMSFVCFLSPFPRKYFYGFLSAGIVAGSSLLFLAPYRVQRILVFLDPWKDPKRGGFQIIQSYLAFANGGIFGQGIGNSNEKLFYLPEAHNDFISSVIGEELGWVGIVGLVVAFVSFLYFGFKISVKRRTVIVTTVIATIVFLLGFQTFLNMGVVLGLLPTKGLNLPFVSYGGSSLIANFAAIGLLISASKWDENGDILELSALREDYNE